MPTGASCAASGAPLGSALGCSVGAALSEAAGVGVTVVDSEDEFFEITATAKITIPNTTAIMIPFEEPVSLLLAFFEEYEEPDAGFGVVEIVDTEDLDDPLTGTAGIE
jgi:hypothetical protein